MKITKTRSRKTGDTVTTTDKSEHEHRLEQDVGVKHSMIWAGTIIIIMFIAYCIVLVKSNVVC